MMAICRNYSGTSSPAFPPNRFFKAFLFKQCQCSLFTCLRRQVRKLFQNLLNTDNRSARLVTQFFYCVNAYFLHFFFLVSFLVLTAFFGLTSLVISSPASDCATKDKTYSTDFLASSFMGIT